MSLRVELSAFLARRSLRLKGKALRALNVSRGDDVRTYQLMQADNAGADARYRAGKFWAKINEDFADLIYAGGLTNLRNQYFNRRFAGPDPCSRSVYAALLWLYYRHVASLDRDGFLGSGEPQEGGQGDQESINGVPMSLDFLQSTEEAYQLRRAYELASRQGSPRVVAELGAGYGRLAYVVRRLLPDCTYVILDLPEALICAKSWLGRVLPGEVVPYEESRALSAFDRETLLRRKLWLLGPHQLEAIAPKSIDAFVNVYSLAEMPRASIENYFRQIDRIVDGVFYTKQRGLEENPDDHDRITAADYPIGPHWRELFRQPATLYHGFFEAAYAIGAKTST